MKGAHVMGVMNLSSYIVLRYAVDADEKRVKTLRWFVKQSGAPSILLMVMVLVMVITMILVMVLAIVSMVRSKNVYRIAFMFT